MKNLFSNSLNDYVDLYYNDAICLENSKKRTYL